MREYRGLTKKGKWVYGYYCQIEYQHFIIVEDAEYIWQEDAYRIRGMVEVIPETVGQSTGLKDKKRTKEFPEGQKIYKGDIVKLMTRKAWLTGEKDKYRNEIVKRGCICGLNTNSMVSIQKEGQEEYEPQLEIIGNIHTNPELLETKQ